MSSDVHHIELQRIVHDIVMSKSTETAELLWVSSGESGTLPDGYNTVTIAEAEYVF